jgi:hypothetical protein
MEEHGYTVYNTNGEDLDLVPEIVKKYDVEAITAFEIFEHLIAPFNILNEIKSTKVNSFCPFKFVVCESV